MPRTPRLVARLIALAVGLALLAGCADDKPEPLAFATLPPGQLSHLVVQPGEVATGLVPLLSQTGTADARRIASFSADPAGAQTSLTAHGFEQAYVVQYADPTTGRSVTNVVTRFATADGATADLTADLAAAGTAGSTFTVSDLGDQAGGIRGFYDTKAQTGELVTLRWRLGDTTWLLAIGAGGKVSESVVRSLADRLVERAQAAS